MELTANGGFFLSEEHRTREGLRFVLSASEKAGGKKVRSDENRIIELIKERG